MKKNLKPKFSEIVGDLGEPVTSIETYQNPLFGFLNVLVINNGRSQWFIAKEVAYSLGYNTDRVDRLLKRYVQPSEIRVLKTANMPNINIYKISKRGLYIISEKGIFQLVLNSTLPNAIEYKMWVLSPYQQGAYVDVISFNEFGSEEIDKDYKLRIINLGFFMLFRQTYIALDPQYNITHKAEPFDIAFKFGESQATSAILTNIQFILSQLSCGASLVDLESWIYFYYPSNYTPKYNIPNGTEIQKMISNNEKQTKIIDAEVIEN